ncbi:protein of unknown function [Candidatus Hydrogenisulfobacillus filiaventi]|uniref:Uncharacterized protein n=1 Tax=Candidatus Hydrogenisulfobacillus filiaventi TaxID=2707344 RepID=A0A6F8ZET1_9FIRM|nr:protein of unknown function [Candidatus Hydrogenisulfobacillus filiaventi]
MASTRTCPHPTAWLTVSGTAVLAAGQAPPAHSLRPKVAAVLARLLAGEDGR